MEDKRVWNAARICFYSMIAVWVISGAYTAYNPIEYTWIDTVLGFGWFGFTIAAFVLSIIHLRKYKPKGFAVTALVISSLGILLIVMGAMYGSMLAMMEP